MEPQGFFMGPLTVICILVLVTGTAGTLFMTVTDAGCSQPPDRSGASHTDQADAIQGKEGITHTGQTGGNPRSTVTGFIRRDPEAGGGARYSGNGRAALVRLKGPV